MRSNALKLIREPLGISPSNCGDVTAIVSDVFRALLQKVGSGAHTNKPLTRSEAERAASLMLQQHATPAQIGAFLIAHRIRRPTSVELAGMLDAYDRFAPTLKPISSDRVPLVFCHPYDGRSRTAPVGIVTALILATAGCPAILHGGDRMPTKMGLPAIEIWRALDVPFHFLTLSQAREVLQATGIGFIYMPQHFPLGQGLVPYREQIGKRPPLATLELMWNPYGGRSRLVCGYVHPPTEKLMRGTLQLRRVEDYLTLKGMEGSCDLPRDRVVICGIHRSSETEFERLCLAPRDYDLAGLDEPGREAEAIAADYRQILEGQSSPLLPSVIWNGGFYLWQAGVCESLAAGLERAEALLQSDLVAAKLVQLQTCVATKLLVRASTCPDK